MRKIIAIFVFIFAALALTGCGGGGSVEYTGPGTGIIQEKHVIEIISTDVNATAQSCGKSGKRMVVHLANDGGDKVLNLVDSTGKACDLNKATPVKGNLSGKYSGWVTDNSGIEGSYDKTSFTLEINDIYNADKGLVYLIDNNGKYYALNADLTEFKDSAQGSVAGGLITYGPYTDDCGGVLPPTPTIPNHKVFVSVDRHVVELAIDNGRIHGLIVGGVDDSIPLTADFQVCWYGDVAGWPGGDEGHRGVCASYTGGGSVVVLGTPSHDTGNWALVSGENRYPFNLGRVTAGNPASGAYNASRGLWSY